MFICMYVNRIFDSMAGRPKKEDSESKSFAIYEKTWRILKELEHSYFQIAGENKSLKEIAHEAIEEYSKKEKKRLENAKK